MNFQFLIDEYQWIDCVLIFFLTGLFFRLSKSLGMARHFSVLMTIGSLYPITELAQIFTIGPSWFRWYFADIGFVPFVALLTAVFVLAFFPKSKWAQVNDQSAILLMRIMLVKRLTWYSAAIAISWELFTIYLQSRGLVRRRVGTPTGDYVDLCILLTMSVLQLWFLFRKEQGAKIAMLR